MFVIIFIGLFQKMPRMALWNSKGKRGLCELEIQRHWGILMIGINESGGGVRSGISTGDRQE